MSRPADLQYTRSHEWIRADGNILTIGITDFAIAQLGDLANVDLPEVGDNFAQDSSFGEMESTKTVAELVSPVSGTVTEVNGAAVDDLNLVSDSPFDGGWLIKIEVEVDDMPDDLLDAEAYEAFLKSESH